MLNLSNTNIKVLRTIEMKNKKKVSGVLRMIVLRSAQNEFSKIGINIRDTLRSRKRLKIIRMYEQKVFTVRDLEANRWILVM